MSTKGEESKVPLPVVISSGFSAAFGIAKAMFALHLLGAATLFGAMVGPYPIIVLSLADAIVGLSVAVTGAFLIWRRRWAAELIRIGWLPLIAYEVGRALGMAGAQPVEVDGYSVITKIVLVLCLLGVWTCVRSPSLDSYLVK